MASLRQWFRHQRLQLGEWLYWRRQVETRTRNALSARSPGRRRSKAP